YTNLVLKTHQELDLLNQTEVRKFFEKEKPEYVVVAAARVGGIAANMEKPAEFLFENLQIQNNIIWSAHEAVVTKLLFLGSSCIYPRECFQPMKEEYFMTGPVEPTNEGYAIAKIAGIELCRSISAEFNQDFISCLPTNIYGENDNFDPESSHVVPALIRKIHDAKVNQQNELVVWGTGKARREFMHVDDLAEACLFLLENFSARNQKVPFVNIGTGEDVSIKELVEKLSKVIGYEGKIMWDHSKPDGMPRKLLEVSKLSKLGWKYKTNLDDGLSLIYQWYLENIYGK
ncbi:MAG: GDP-L-fucose synthase, partial [Candidatus Magasanikbacteria bacterium]